MDKVLPTRGPDMHFGTQIQQKYIYIYHGRLGGQTFSDPWTGNKTIF